MNKHCKDCKFHYNAGHPKDSPLAKKYNDWCPAHGTTAKDAIGHCKLTGMKELKNA
jgi:hypothetical protein